MNEYIGVKLLRAKPMTKLDYNVLRGWEQPSDEDPKEEGYLVEYQNGGKPCHPDFKGYISWSPKDVFEQSYKQSGELSFGNALTYMKLGHKVARKGWNGKGMYLKLVEADFWELLDTKFPEMQRGPNWNLDPFILMKTATNTLVPWLASQSDMLADDWELIND